MAIMDFLNGGPQTGIFRYMQGQPGAAAQPNAPMPERRNRVVDSPAFSNTMMRLGLNLMQAGGETDNPLTAFGVAGGSTLSQMEAERQAQVKAQLDQAQADYYGAKGNSESAYGVQSQGFEGDIARAMNVLRNPNSTEDERKVAQGVVDTAQRLIPQFNATTGAFDNQHKAILPVAAAASSAPVATSAPGSPAAPSLLPPPSGNEAPDQTMFSGNYQSTPKSKALQSSAVIEGIAKVDTDTFGAIAQQTRKLDEMVPELQRVRAMAKNTTTGGPGVARLAFGKALGLDLDGQSEAEAIQAVTSRLAPAMRIPGSGSSSDVDVNMFLQSLPSLWNSEGGIDKIVDGYERVLARRKEEEKIARRLLREDNSLERFGEETAKLGPVFKENEFKAPGATAPVIDAPGVKVWSFKNGKLQ